MKRQFVVYQFTFTFTIVRDLRPLGCQRAALTATLDDHIFPAKNSYKTWKDIHPSQADSSDTINNLQRLLAKAILHCIEKDRLTKALRESCKKWAIQGREDDIFNAAFITGKAAVLFD